MWPFSRRKRRLRPIGEAEAYQRSYGARNEDVRNVKRVPSPPRRPRHDEVLRAGEKLRRAFAERLERRHARPPDS